MKCFLMLFLDGVGIGTENPDFNPFFKKKFKTFDNLFSGTPSLRNRRISGLNAEIFPADARMGVPGIPQSGTGQISLFCGRNAPGILGRHFGPFPPQSLKSILFKENILAEFIRRGLRAEFVNAYPKIFFDHIGAGRPQSASSLMAQASGLRLKGSGDLRQCLALSSDITQKKWREDLGYANMPEIKAATAARRLRRISMRNNFTLFEYFLSDHLGHLRHAEDLQENLDTLDEFLYELLREVPPELNILVASDHGNLEDLSSKMHSLNPALMIAAGENCSLLSSKIKYLYDVKEAVMSLL